MSAEQMLLGEMSQWQLYSRCSQDPTFKSWSKLGQYQQRYEILLIWTYVTMVVGILEGLRNLRLKFGQNRVSNSYT